jgi:hypothetical protein
MWHAVSRAEALEKNPIFLKCSPSKSLEKENAIRSTIEEDMNILVDDRISNTRDFANQFVVFPARSGHENPEEKAVSRLSREQLDAFLNTQSDNAHSPHFFMPAAEPPAPAAEKGLAAGVLKQAAYDLRRFHAATTGVKQAMYLDAYSWIIANDFSWPYSFLNVCKMLDLCPEIVRMELLADASLGWFDYWTRRVGRLSRRLQTSLFAYWQAAVIRRARRPAKWLHVFKRDMKTYCIQLVERLRYAWRSFVRAANCNQRFVPRREHGFF